MNMKKILLLLLTLALVLSIFASCNSTDANDGTDAPEKPTSDATDNPTEAPTDTPTDKPTETPTEKPTDNGNENGGEDEYDTITIAKALELCGEPGNLTTERYYIRATIVSIDNAQYGAMTIADDTGSIPVYGTYSADGEINYSAMEDKPYKGDEVLLYCTLQNYNGTKEVKSAWLISFKHVEIEIDESQYTDMSIADAREAAVGTKIKVDGVVARITYANGMVPMGVYLVDDTQSIYVYDGDLAQRVNIGNRVTVLGSKTYWILDSEKSNAQKFGYKGCCQLEDVTVLDIKTEGKPANISWVQESTVKDILDTPVTENVTSSIFKVNALVKKVPGSGFTNYYFFDLDGETGSYAYSQCNGNDFAWLDEFDGKICKVYLSPLNAKSTSSSCYFRFIPVAVFDEGFKFDTTKAAQHAVEYVGVTQFLSSYTGNPAKELATSVSSELLGFENATLSYTSSDENVVYFTTEGGKVIFNCKDAGKATVTVKGSFGGVDYSEDIEITVLPNATYESITIEEAKSKEVGEKVIIKGIVGPSLVNKSGFYLFDGTGMVAITLADASAFSELEIGYEVVLEGTRDCFKDADKTHAGQLAISNCTIVANYYGENDYHTFDFITDKDLKYIYDLDENEQHSDKVYVVKATVTLEETKYYTNIFLSGNGVSLRLYCSCASQYSFLKAFAGQEVTVEVAPCNWNNKTYYTGCVLSVTTADGTVVLNELNFQ